MKYLSNLPPGCTARMIDEQCADSWECETCGETLDEGDLCECGSCLSLYCKECVEEDEASSTDYFCETCAASRRIKAFSDQRLAISSQPVAEPERFYRVTPNSCDLAEGRSFEEAA